MNKKITITLTDREYALYQGLAIYMHKKTPEEYIQYTLRQGFRRCKNNYRSLYDEISMDTDLLDSENKQYKEFRKRNVLTPEKLEEMMKKKQDTDNE